MKIPYATFSLKVLAEESEIDTNELALSDMFYKLEDELKEWLGRQETPFDLVLEET